MCSNDGQSGAPPRPEADLAARLAAAIDELAAAAGSPASTGTDDIEADLTEPDSGSEDPSTQGTAAEGTVSGSSAARMCAERNLTEQDLVERLARAWAMITAADPEVAARTVHYSGP
jgi:hypothetical protein